jgi:aminoglycoside 3-N-acetyltransferase
MVSDAILVLLEGLSRRIYWSWPDLRSWMRRKGRSAKPNRQQCRRDDLLRYLGEIGVKKGALVMAHTGIGGLELIDENCRDLSNPIAFAETLMEDLLGAVGPDGTLVMPTHARYQGIELSDGIGSHQITTYDPRRTPCGVGLVNELFWRRQGVQRSLFPYNMLAACGPLAGELFRDNLNERHPSPHGLDSGYYRICRLNGLVVSVGVPLRECITIAHVVEEVRADWPIEDFFIERQYRVVQDGVAKLWTVRLRRDEYAKYSYCRKKMGRDLIAEGVIHEGSVGTVRVDWARAGEVYDYFWRKTGKKPYPYYGLWMMSKPWRKSQ